MSPQPPSTPNIDNLNVIRPESVVADPNALAVAQQEDNFFAQDKKKREHVREQRVKSAINYVIVGVIVISGLLLVTAIGVRVVHMIIPESYGWLSEKQIGTLDNLAKYAGSGALGITLTKYLSKNIGENTQ